MDACLPQYLSPRVAGTPSVQVGEAWNGHPRGQLKTVAGHGTAGGVGRGRERCGRERCGGGRSVGGAVGGRQDGWLGRGSTPCAVRVRRAAGGGTGAWGGPGEGVLPRSAGSLRSPDSGAGASEAQQPTRPPRPPPGPPAPSSPAQHHPPPNVRTPSPAPPHTLPPKGLRPFETAAPRPPQGWRWMGCGPGPPFETAAARPPHG